MKKLTLITFFSLTVLIFNGCQNAGNNTANTTTNATVTNTTTANNTTAANNTTVPAKTENAAHSLNPTDTLKAFISAYQKKDVDEMKKYLSKGSLEMFRQAAELQGKTEKELMTSDDMPFKEMPEMRNEKIEGDTASVEVKVEGKWEKTPLVKENGSWKLAFDKS